MLEHLSTGVPQASIIGRRMFLTKITIFYQQTKHLMIPSLYFIRLGFNKRKH